MHLRYFMTFRSFRAARAKTLFSLSFIDGFGTKNHKITLLVSTNRIRSQNHENDCRMVANSYPNTQKTGAKATKGPPKSSPAEKHRYLIPKRESASNRFWSHFPPRGRGRLLPDRIFGPCKMYIFLVLLGFEQTGRFVEIFSRKINPRIDREI